MTNDELEEIIVKMATQFNDNYQKFDRWGETFNHYLENPEMISSMEILGIFVWILQLLIDLNVKFITTNMMGSGKITPDMLKKILSVDDTEKSKLQ